MASTASAASRGSKTKSASAASNGRSTGSRRAAAAKTSADTAATAKSGAARQRMAPADQPSEMQEGLKELFTAMLKDIYYAEKQILKSLPKMAKAAKTDELKQGFEQHREETAGQIERLEKVFAAIGHKAKGEQCEAIQGILEEGKEVMEDFKGKPALDIGLCGAGKAVEHYEIARYSSLRTLAQHLGMKDVAKLIEANLAEEMKTDKLLDQMAQTVMLSKAV